MGAHNPPTEPIDLFTGETAVAGGGFAARMLHSLRSLSVPVFRLYLVASLLGTTSLGMQKIAQNWLMLEVSGGAGGVGLSVFMQYVPYIVFGPYAGVLVDRWNRRVVLLVTQSLFALFALALGALVLFDHVTFGAVMLFSLLTGFVQIVDAPAKQSYIQELVGRHLLPNAIVLNSSVFQVGQLIGPAAAGVAIATIGSSWALLCNGLLFAADLVILAFVRPPGKGGVSSTRTGREKVRLRDGVRFALAHTSLLWTLIAVAVVSALVTTSPVFLSAYASGVHSTGSGGYGLFTSLVAVGGIIGGIVSSWKRRLSVSSVLWAMLIFAMLQLCVAMLPVLSAFLVGLIVLGVFNMLWLTYSNTLLQLSSPSSMRGRIMALYSSTMMGGVGLGSLIVGFSIEAFGAIRTAIGSAVVQIVVLAVVLCWLWSRRLRRARSA